MSDNATREIFITGMKNAHAMETQALSIMKPQVKRIENYPDVAARLEQHITETEGQLARIEEILSGLDEDHSKLKIWRFRLPARWPQWAIRSRVTRYSRIRSQTSRSKTSR